MFAKYLHKANYVLGYQSCFTDDFFFYVEGLIYLIAVN